MGCKVSTVKGDGAPINPAHLPPVPEKSWYARKFVDFTPMPVTDFHVRHKGHTLFSRSKIPLRKTEIDALPAGPQLQSQFTLGVDTIYGMAYLHNTALFIEHHWRTRVQWNMGAEKYDKPFYNTLLGVKVFINDVLVPDSFPFGESIPFCTSTIRAPDAVSMWVAVPIVLCGHPDDEVLKTISLYRGLMFSFLEAAITLQPGEHDVRVEVVYGCKAESNFCTEFISRGGLKVMVTNESRELLSGYLSVLSGMLEEHPRTTIPKMSLPHEPCVYCNTPKAYLCAICGAEICCSPQCVWSPVVGYPFGCKSHKASTR